MTTISAPVRTFTVDDCQRRWCCSAETAREILRGFVELGLVVLVDDGYAVTEAGVAASHRVGELKP